MRRKCSCVKSDLCSKILSRLFLMENPRGASNTSKAFVSRDAKTRFTTRASGRFDVGRLPEILSQAEYSTSLLRRYFHCRSALQKRARPPKYCRPNLPPFGFSSPNATLDHLFREEGLRLNNRRCSRRDICRMNISAIYLGDKISSNSR